jgi:hypothetical protein
METGMFLLKFNGKNIKIVTPLDYLIHSESLIIEGVNGSNIL